MYTYLLLYIELRELCLLIDIGNRKTSVFFMLSLHFIDYTPISCLLIFLWFVIFFRNIFAYEFKKGFLKIIRSNILNYICIDVYIDVFVSSLFSKTH